MQIIDISPEISEQAAVFPGDQPFSRKVALSFAKGDHLELSSIEMSVHIGAHTDAPSHYHGEGEAIDARALDIYYGPAQVIEVKKNKGRILPSDFGDEIVAERVLFKTGSFGDPNKWQDDFASLSPQLVEDLAGRGVRLVGIDTPSVDPANDKVLESHNAIYQSNMAILEGIVLDQVEPGTYTLCALPLKIKGCDASPVRAVLLRN